MIFLDDEDRLRYLSLLGGVIEKFRWHCLAYCLMPNHVHLLIETTEPNLGRGMHSLHGLYAQTFNERNGRVGHLFQSRFGSRAVFDEAGLMRVAAYIGANPVAAGLCAAAEEWPWSSHRATVGLGSDRIVDVDRLGAHIAPRGDVAGLYAALVAARITGGLPVSV